ncbi:MAG: hypothetical protein SFX72_11775 [Isosphaeraceae bacterium]|nr:hypothetical protein [Isosphaeraceae bacterium]
MRNRMSLARSMVLTGVTAANLGFVSAADRVPDLIIAVYTCGPILLFVQLALWFAVVGGPERRAFRIGFAAAGTLGTIALTSCFRYMPAQESILQVYAGFWSAVGRLAPGFERFVSSSDSRRDLAFGIFFFVPQILLATVGGALADRAARMGWVPGGDARRSRGGPGAATRSE